MMVAVRVLMHGHPLKRCCSDGCSEGSDVRPPFEAVPAGCVQQQAGPCVFSRLCVFSSEQPMPIHTLA